MRTFKIEGIVIKRKNFQESDKIVTVFSKEKGVIRLKAPGVRKITSRRSPHIELFNHCKFTLYQGKSIAILTEIEPIENFKNFKKDLKRVGIAYHLSELIEGLCPENQQNLAIFDLLLSTFNKLSNEENLDKLIYDFEIKLLTLLGYHKKSMSLEKIDTIGKIEEILERRLKTKQILPQLS
jgi:DNA repair protein RecO (recombination protein O)